MLDVKASLLSCIIMSGLAQILKPAEKKHKYMYAMNPRPATPPRA